MSAVLREPRQLFELTVAQVDAVLAIENAAYPFPWSRGNFIDSLAAGYPSRLLVDAQGLLLGYFVAMDGVDEMHLLNITVAPACQGRGHGRFMLDRLVALCRARAAARLWLEVRDSNARARGLYLRYGFRHVGQRKRYYPAAAGQREDAVVMSLDVDSAAPPAASTAPPCAHSVAASGSNARPVGKASAHRVALPATRRSPNAAIALPASARGGAAAQIAFNA